MARILFVQPSMQPPGGGNGVAAWMLQALADGHDVTLLTCAPCHLHGRASGVAVAPCLRHPGPVPRR